MSTNILNAIVNVVEHPVNDLKNFYNRKNRANSMGETLEEYIKDIFAGTLLEDDEAKRLEKLQIAFSYLGNQNNPPDIIIRNGDAIEVKKIENRKSSLALNSSYPKAKLFSNCGMITDKCKSCENWNEKDIIYSVGVVNKNKLLSLFFVYGVDYAASKEVYEKIKRVISTGVNIIPDIEFAETKELGRVNRVDPLGITYLRIRGMWGIENPIKTFNYIYNDIQNNDFELVALINTDKYNSFSFGLRNKIENMPDSCKNFGIKNVKIKTPDNPVVLKNAKLITFFR